jgi:hypothetical protein
MRVRATTGRKTFRWSGRLGGNSAFVAENADPKAGQVQESLPQRLAGPQVSREGRNSILDALGDVVEAVLRELNLGVPQIGIGGVVD